MKKFLTVAWVCLLTMSLLWGCGTRQVVVTADDFPWRADLENHWQETELEEILEEGAHTFSNSVCTLCGAEIMDNEGETWITLTNDYGDIVQWVIYDEDGLMIQNTRTCYTYDQDGNWVTETIYEFDVLSLEAEYTLVNTDEGEDIFASRITTWQEDGTRLVEEFEYGVSAYQESLYDAEGTLVYSYTVEYEFREDGYMTALRKSQGDTVVQELRYSYDDYGNPLLDQSYVNGKLVREDVYTQVTDEEGLVYTYLSQIIIYNEDGTQTITELDEYGQILNLE